MTDDRAGPSEATGSSTPPGTESLWLATTPATDYPSLDGDRRVDVVVVGGGITGLTAAVRLVEAGRSVAVLEADRVAAGVTGRTTAKVTSQHGLVYARLVDAFGPERARQYAEANEAAIDEIAGRVQEEGIDCAFERRPAYTYATSTEDARAVREEVEAARALGLSASYTESTELPFEVEAAVRFDDQAQFHPREYLLSIAASIDGHDSDSGEDDGDGHVFEETRVTDVDPGSPCRVETPHGEVVADDVFVASHFPVLDRAGYFARMHPKAAYLLAVRLERSPPDGMYISTDEPPRTMRTHPTDDGSLLLVGGEGHPPGEGSTAERYRRCEAFAREHFAVEEVVYRWSTHDHYPVDGVPFVGSLGPLTENVHVGTGFGGWGMSGGTAAGMILSDLVVEGSSPWSEVFDPLRFTPVASARSFVRENASVGARFFGDRLEALLAGDDVPARGEADVVRRDGESVGVFRDDEGTVHAVSAVCPHMKCLVRWNDAERTWDCPCHGSRFTYEGDVLSGPSVLGLPNRRP